MRNKKAKQETFNAHFAEGFHEGENDWNVRLIDQGVSLDDVKRRESFYQH